jgi:hypothetical protein
MPVALPPSPRAVVLGCSDGLSPAGFYGGPTARWFVKFVWFAVKVSALFDFFCFRFLPSTRFSSGFSFQV